MEKNKQTPNHLTQTLNKSTMYEPVLSLKSSCVWHERAKAVSPKYKSQGLERGCWPGVGFWQERPSLKRSHVPWVSYSDQMIILELDYQERSDSEWKHQLQKSKGNSLKNKDEKKKQWKKKTMKKSKAEGKKAGVLALCTAFLGGTANMENHCTWEHQGHMQGLHLERSLLQEAMGVTRNQAHSSCWGRKNSWTPSLKSKVIKRFGQIIRHARSDPNQRLKNKKDFW